MGRKFSVYDRRCPQCNYVTRHGDNYRHSELKIQVFECDACGLRWYI